MKLPLFSSKAGDPAPNLVGVQHERFAALPTRLVCPLQPADSANAGSVVCVIAGEPHAVRCDLVRPIHRAVLRSAGQLDEENSRRIVQHLHELVADSK